VTDDLVNDKVAVEGRAVTCWVMLADTTEAAKSNEPRYCAVIECVPAAP